MKTVIFDLDGTLADTSGDLIASANACFAQMGLGALLDPNKDQSLAMGGGGRVMLKTGFERAGLSNIEARVLEYYPVLLTAYEENIAVHTSLYDGSVGAIERLIEGGYNVGMCTNKPEGLANILLTELGVRSLFGSLIGADTLAVRKPDPLPLLEAINRVNGDKSHAILVGDTITDRKTALAAGVKSALVTFGPDGHDVEKLEPDACLHHYDDLDQVVLELIG